MRRFVKQPKKRGALRLRLGRAYFIARRYAYWAFGGLCFARRRGGVLPHEHFAHQTPLFRQLKDVDMYLQYNKVENLKIALPRISGVILHPGETLSYWRLIGRPTRRKGYLPGMILDSGRFLAGVGGGLCQLSNLIFWMALHTPLTITERHRHGYDVFPDADRTQPFGSGATCYWNYGDLMLRNDTPHQFQLLLNLTDTHLAGRWCADIPLDYRYEIYEKDHAIQSHFWGNTRHNAIWRKKFDFDNNLLYDEPIAENHAIMMYPPFLPDTSQT